MALRVDRVHRAAEQTDPTLELEQLCDEIGPRLTGSVAAQAAERQVVEYMRKAGLQQVHTEGWTLPRGWLRGPAVAWLVSMITGARTPVQVRVFPSSPSVVPSSLPPTSLPLKIRILALQVTLRVWDQRTQQARQVTIIQDM